MIWVAFVISMVTTPDGGEVKWTRYSEHETEWSCIIAMDKLNQEFEVGEEAICLKVSNG